MDVINAATKSVDQVVRRAMPQGKKVKKTLSTSSGSSNATENKAKNFYERMTKEHSQIGATKP